MYNTPAKLELGLPAMGETPLSPSESRKDVLWSKFGIEAEKEVNSKLLILAEPPGLITPQANSGGKLMDAERSIAAWFRCRWPTRATGLSLSWARSIECKPPLVAEIELFWAIVLPPR